MNRYATRTARVTSFVAGGLAALACAAPAAAQTAGWALDRYDPTFAGDVFFAAQFPQYSGIDPVAVRFGVVADYARNPLVLRRPGQEAQPVISDMLVGHAQIGVALFDRLGLNLSLPVSLMQAGPMNTPDVRIQPAGDPTVGDFRASGRVRIVGRADRDPISLHLGGHASFGQFGPTRTQANVSEGGLHGRGFLVLAGRGGPVRWSLEGGFYFRPGAGESNVAIGNEVYANAALGFVAANDRLTIGPEIWASTNADRAFEYAHVNAEAILGIHYLISDAVLIGFGGGPGLTQGAGTPQVRGLFHLAYSPPERQPAPVAEAPVELDTDRDGVLDRDDLCVREPAGAHPDPARRGCPLRDQDNDGVFDNEDQCPTEPKGEHPDPARNGCPAQDTDGDGVFDNEDQCVTTPRGDNPDPDRAGCPDGDDDNDGVLNHADQCRTQHHGVHPDPARPGCPLPDRDNDSVPDPTDHCPDEPGAPSTNPQRNGCPGLVRVEGGTIRILQPVFFATNRDRILPRSFPVLRALADAMRAQPEIRRVSIEGHTDNVGDDARNLDLSQRRSNSVMAWLIRNGIEPGRLEAHGYGETRPIESNDTREGRAANRRVEFRIIDPASTGAPGSDATAPAPDAPAPAAPAADAPAPATPAPTPAPATPAPTPAP